MCHWLSVIRLSVQFSSIVTCWWCVQVIIKKARPFVPVAVALTCASELVGCSAPGHQPLAPLYNIPFVDPLRRIQQIVQDLVQVLRIRAVRTIRVDVGRGGPFALREQHLRLKRWIWGHDLSSSHSNTATVSHVTTTTSSNKTRSLVSVTTTAATTTIVRNNKQRDNRNNGASCTVATCLTRWCWDASTTSPRKWKPHKTPKLIIRETLRSNNPEQNSEPKHDDPTPTSHLL